MVHANQVLANIRVFATKPTLVTAALGKKLVYIRSILEVSSIILKRI